MDNCLRKIGADVGLSDIDLSTTQPIELKPFFDAYDYATRVLRKYDFNGDYKKFYDAWKLDPSAFEPSADYESWFNYESGLIQ